MKVTVTSGDTSYEQPVSLTVAAPGTLLAAYNNTGVSDDTGEHDEADYDGGGWSYSLQALAAAGLTPGGTGTVDGLGFTWPGSPNGRPDNVSAAGQTLQLPQPAANLSFVGSAVNGNQQTKATVTYTDGSTDVVDLSFTDWTCRRGRRHRAVRQRGRRSDRLPQMSRVRTRTRSSPMCSPPSRSRHRRARPSRA
ncbi:hypothetical protein ACRAWF_13010 [Streptomyces sp. L7]